MATEYHFEISSDWTSEQAKRAFAKHLDAELTPNGFVNKQDILISASDVPPGRRTEMAEREFHFTPTLLAIFRREYEADPAEFVRLMLRATMLLLEHGRDAVLLFNGEIIVFQRLGGKLVFNTDYQLQVGKDEALLREEVHIPYERRSLPSPLL